MNPLTFLMVNVATIFLIKQGALQVQMGVIKQGDVVAMYNYMAQMIVELIKFAALVVTITKGLAGANRVADVMDIEQGMEYPIDTLKKKNKNKNKDNKKDNLTAVKFEDVSFAYDTSGEEAVTDINFVAKKGQTIGIIGATGSGKSTLVNLIPRFYDATSGKVFVDGKDVREYSKDSLLSKFGIVPQKAVLFEGTIRDNLKWGNDKADDKQLWEAIELAQATDVVKGKSEGLDYHVEQNGRNLSGGQKQRLTIARALVKKPKILILDDSSSALDFATDAKLRSAIAGLDKNMTVFIVSQRTSSIRHADKILVLDDGCIVGSGTHEKLMEICDVYQEIYYSQFPDEKKSVKDVATNIKDNRQLTAKEVTV
jgi:ABC-type multidrug transport system fused ATPase/permease subunit